MQPRPKLPDATRTLASAPLSAEPNVTPMIDVLMVLLVIFFFVVGPGFFHQSPVQLPEEQGGAPGIPIVLEVFPGGRYAINHRPVPRGALEARLRTIYAGRPDKVITVKGDPTAKYDEVFHAVDIAKSAGVRVVGIAPKDCCR